MFTTKLRKVGNSQMVAVPKAELERMGIPEGATVMVEVREVHVTVEPVLPPHLKEAAEKALAWGEPGLRYLAEH